MCGPRHSNSFVPSLVGTRALFYRVLRPTGSIIPANTSWAFFPIPTPTMLITLVWPLGEKKGLCQKVASHTGAELKGGMN